MSEFFEALAPDHIDFIESQPVFFVATAASEGRINLSPKGLDTFRVLSPTRVAYLDLGGSGNETHAHLAADGRLTIMFCHFSNPALIYRIYGRGRSVLPADSEWAALSASFELLPGTRQIFDIEIESTQTSCGWGVPRMTLDRERSTLPDYHAKSDPEDWVQKVAGRRRSIDGLPIRPTDRFFGRDGEGKPPAARGRGTDSA